MSAPYLPPVQPYHPTTFLERGVAVPFTTPLLGGTRARPTEKGGLELVIPNPSGGRGVYVMGWNGITALCRPTLHDTLLSEGIGALGSVTPTAIRRIGREVAAEGLAGEDAMEAAQRAMQKEQGDRLLMNYRLLVALVEQVGVAPATDGATALNMEARARMTVAHLAPRLGQTAPWIAAALEAIADCVSLVGIDRTQSDCRVPRLMAMLRETREQVGAWSETQVEDDQAGAGRMVCAVADLTMALAATTLGRAYGLTGDMVELLRAWGTGRESIAAVTARPEWLLDGWEKICLVWQEARDEAERRAAVAEMAQLIPVVPREARDWCDLDVDVDITLRLRKMVRLNEDWRTGGMVYALIARNERFAAITC